MTMPLRYMAFALLGVFIIAAVSCSDDENEAQGSHREDIDYTLTASGSVSISNNDGTTLYVSNVKDAGYRLWASDANMSDLTISFKAILSPENGLSVNRKKITLIGFDVPFGGKLEIGEITDVGRLKFSYYVQSGSYYESQSEWGWFSGTVTVENFEANKYVTLKFTDCESITKPYDRFDGTITFAIRKRDFFE